MGRKKYLTEEERKEALRECHRKYYQKNKNRILKKQNDYYQDNKDIYQKYYGKNRDKIIGKQKEYNLEYDHTPMGRAQSLLQSYKRADKNANRGKGDITAKWIVENIFSKPCSHCGIEGWKIIGCNRLDNSKPHTMDNVEPCCFKCNIALLNMEIDRDKNGRYMKKDH